jgi:hypothetical protein
VGARSRSRPGAVSGGHAQRRGALGRFHRGPGDARRRQGLSPPGGGYAAGLDPASLRSKRLCPVHPFTEMFRPDGTSGSRRPSDARSDTARFPIGRRWTGSGMCCRSSVRRASDIAADTSRLRALACPRKRALDGVGGPPRVHRQPRHRSWGPSRKTIGLRDQGPAWPGRPVSARRSERRSVCGNARSPFAHWDAATRDAGRRVARARAIGTAAPGMTALGASSGPA